MVFDHLVLLLKNSYFGDSTTLRSVVSLAMFTEYICESSSNHPMDVQLEQIHLLIHHRDNSYYQVRGIGPNDDKRGRGLANDAVDLQS